MLALEMRRRLGGPEIGRLAETRDANGPAEAMARLTRQGWPREAVLVLSGPALFKTTVMPRLSRNEWRSAAALSLESEGWIGGDVLPAFRVTSVPDHHKLAVQAVAWRDPGLSALTKAAGEAGFRIVAAYHSAAAVLAAMRRQLGSKESWLACPDGQGCDLVLVSPGGVGNYRRIETGGPDDVESAAAEIARTVAGQGGNAFPMVVLGDGEYPGILVQALVNLGLRARKGRATVGMSGRAASDAGQYAPLIGAGLSRLGYADARPDLLTALAGEVSGRRLNPTPAWLMGAALLAAISGAALLGLRTRNDLARTAAWVESRRPEYEAVSARLEECLRVEQRVAVLQSVLDDRRDYLESLRLLELSLPDGTRLSSLAFEGDLLIELSGTAPRASQVMAALEKSGGFRELEFRGPIRVVDVKGQRAEEFHVAGRLAVGEAKTQ